MGKGDPLKKGTTKKPRKVTKEAKAMKGHGAAMARLESDVSRGRPPVYEDEHFPEMCFKFRLLGADIPKLSIVFGVSESVLNDWIALHPNFSKAYYDGGEKADAIVAEAMYHLAKGYQNKTQVVRNGPDGPEVIDVIESIPPNPRAGMYWLNNRQRRSGNWTDTQKKEITGADGGPIQVESDSDAKAAASRAALMAQLGSDE